MKQFVTLTLAAALALSLCACGGNKAPGASSSAPSASTSQPSASLPGSSSSADQSQPDASVPDGSQPVQEPAPAPQPDGSQPLAPLPAEDGKVTLTLNKTDVTLKAAGASFRLRYTATPDTDGIASFTSDKPEVASVAEDGTVTAVSPGSAVITVEYDGAAETCIVRCRWTEDGDGSSSSSSSSSGSSAASGVDLQAFYDDVTGKYGFSFLELADDTLLEQFYSGLAGIPTEQRLVYICMLSMNNGELGLVQVKDSKDVDAVKAAFQARIDYMVGDGNGPGGAWYPGPTEQWANNSRIVSNGNYVMMVVHENCDDIVSEFNALF